MRKLPHEAGATGAAGLSCEELDHLILEGGFQPARRDSFHELMGVS